MYVNSFKLAKTCGCCLIAEFSLWVFVYMFVSQVETWAMIATLCVCVFFPFFLSALFWEHLEISWHLLSRLSSGCFVTVRELCRFCAISFTPNSGHIVSHIFPRNFWQENAHKQLSLNQQFLFPFIEKRMTLDVLHETDFIFVKNQFPSFYFTIHTTELEESAF